MTRYIVATIAEARASGCRAAGFRAEATAHGWVGRLRAGTKRPDVMRWTIEPRDTAAIIDTSTPLATPERRPAAGWNIDPGRDFASLNIGSMALVASQSDDGLFRWLLDDGHHVEDAGGLPTLNAAMCDCEDAAARLLLAALAELPDARRLMAEALAGREGK